MHNIAGTLCICLNKHTHTRARAHTHTHAHTRAHTRTHSHTHAHSHAHTRTHTYVRTHKHIHMDTHAHTHARMYAQHAYLHTRIDTHTYTRTHAHTHAHMHTTHKQFLLGSCLAGSVMVHLEIIRPKGSIYRTPCRPRYNISGEDFIFLAASCDLTCLAFFQLTWSHTSFLSIVIITIRLTVAHAACYLDCRYFASRADVECIFIVRLPSMLYNVH